LAIQLKIANKPLSLSFKEIAGAGALAGMGLTVSLFIADLALTSATDLALSKSWIDFCGADIRDFRYIYS